MKHKINRKTRAKEIFDKVVKNVQTIVANGEYEKYLKFQNHTNNCRNASTRKDKSKKSYRWQRS